MANYTCPQLAPTEILVMYHFLVVRWLRIAMLVIGSESTMP